MLAVVSGRGQDAGRVSGRGQDAGRVSDGGYDAGCTPKRAGQDPETFSQEAIYDATLDRTSSRYQVFSLRIYSGNRAKMPLKSHLGTDVTSNITRSSDSFSTVPPIVNGGDCGCIVRDLETIIVLVLLSFNFIPQRSHHSPTLRRSRIRDSAALTLTPGDDTVIKVESSA